MRTLRRLGLPALFALVMAGAQADAALAICNPQSVTDALATAPVVFVGNVTDVSQSDGTATLDVVEIWRGPNLPDPVTISTRQIEGRAFQNGARYLVFPVVQPDGTLTDSCNTATSVYTAEFDVLRPAGAHAPQGPPTSGVPGTTPIAAIFLAIVVFGAIGAFFLFRTGTGPAHSP